MKRKVEVVGKGLIHYCASCRQCDWVYEDYLYPNKGNMLAKNHVLKTGHTVIVDKGYAIIYGPKEQPKISEFDDVKDLNEIDSMESDYEEVLGESDLPY